MSRIIRLNVNTDCFKIAYLWREMILATGPENWRFSFFTGKIWLLNVIKTAPHDTIPNSKTNLFFLFDEIFMQ